MQKDCRNNPCQRFGSALNLNVHLHVLVLDGAYTFEGRHPRFHRAPAPSGQELAHLLDALIGRITRTLVRAGVLVEDPCEDMDVPEPNDNNTDDGGPTDGPDLEEILELDLVEREIETIIWATGLNCDFSWIDLPVLNERGYPIQQRGISEYPGLYFCGLHWMHNMKSGLFLGVGDDARHVTQHIADNRSLG